MAEQRRIIRDKLRRRIEESTKKTRELLMQDMYRDGHQLQQKMRTMTKAEREAQRAIIEMCLARATACKADIGRVNEKINRLYKHHQLKEPKILVYNSPSKALEAIYKLPYGTVKSNENALTRYKKLHEKFLRPGFVKMNMKSSEEMFRNVVLAVDKMISPLRSVSAMTWAPTAQSRTAGKFPNPLRPGAMADVMPHDSAFTPSMMIVNEFIRWDYTMSKAFSRREAQCLKAAADLHKENFFYIWFFSGVCVWVLPPMLKFHTERQDQYVLHSEVGPAVSFPEKSGDAYYWNGVQCPPGIILDPESYDPKEVMIEPNLELKRVMFERIGWLKVIDTLGGKTVQIDDYGELIEVNLGDDNGMPARFCVVICPSTSRKYAIRVDPETRSCLEGLATAAGMTPKEYVFASET